MVCLAVVILLIAACGGGDDDEGADPASSDPVVIEHLFGATTVPESPMRIVSLDLQWTDVLLALDAPVIAAGAHPLVEGGLFSWQTPRIGDDVEILQVTGGVPFERIAALQPDLIVGTLAITDPETYETLSVIAPTIGPLTEQQVESWQDLAEAAGVMLRDEAAASSVIAEVDALGDELGDDFPGLAGRTLAFANYVPGAGIFVLADPDDGAGRLFAQLGLEIDPEMVELAAGTAGRTQLSVEQIGLLDSDILMMLTNDADPADIPGFAELPAVNAGAFVILDLETAVGLNTPTPLSIPPLLDTLRPAFEAAAA
ncbi:MAG: ABC transporter substrate-binding protein [Actinomycetota bacterium]